MQINKHHITLPANLALHIKTTRQHLGSNPMYVTNLYASFSAVQVKESWTFVRGIVLQRFIVFQCHVGMGRFLSDKMIRGFMICDYKSSIVVKLN